MNLTTTQRNCLGELAAACNERVKFYGSEWVRSFHLSGTPQERSATTLRSLVSLGLAEGKKAPGSKQAQYLWRVTDAGRALLDGAA